MIYSKEIDELSDQDIKDQLLDQIKQSPFFAIRVQCDETTDIGKCAQLLLYAGFLSANAAKKNAILPPNKKSCNINRYF